MELVFDVAPTAANHVEQKLAQVTEVIFEQIEAVPALLSWFCPTQEPF